MSYYTIDVDKLDLHKPLSELIIVAVDDLARQRRKDKSFRFKGATWAEIANNKICTACLGGIVLSKGLKIKPRRRNDKTYLESITNIGYASIGTVTNKSHLTKVLPALNLIRKGYISLALEVFYPHRDISYNTLSALNLSTIRETTDEEVNNEFPAFSRRMRKLARQLKKLGY